MEDNPFDADEITVDNWEPMLAVRKKPVVVHATQLNMPFRVTTEEGVMAGRAGDYLMIGVRGEKYPIRKDIFEETYDIIEKKDLPLTASDGSVNSEA